jgi:hypothetical protein
MLSWLFIKTGGPAAFQAYGKGESEAVWRVIDVIATDRRNSTSRWPFFGGTCITWTSRVIAVGWDFAEWVLREQMAAPASRELPVEVGGGRLHDPKRRSAAQAPSFPLASEILAHECGHTCQARRFGPLYLPIGAAFTWWREGRHWWNWFENQASEIGQFGGIISGSVHPDLWAAVRPDERRRHPPSEPA